MVLLHMVLFSQYILFICLLSDHIHITYILYLMEKYSADFSMIIDGLVVKIQILVLSQIKKSSLPLQLKKGFPLLEEPTQSLLQSHD